MGLGGLNAGGLCAQELESMKNRAYSMGSPHQQCEFCAEPLFGSRQFYLFPCSHGFHAHCLLQHVPKQLNPAQRAAVQGVEVGVGGCPACCCVFHRVIGCTSLAFGAMGLRLILAIRLPVNFSVRSQLC